MCLCVVCFVFVTFYLWFFDVGSHDCDKTFNFCFENWQFYNWWNEIILYCFSDHKYWSPYDSIKFKHLQFLINFFLSTSSVSVVCEISIWFISDDVSPHHIGTLFMGHSKHRHKYKYKHLDNDLITDMHLDIQKKHTFTIDWCVVVVFIVSISIMHFIYFWLI